MPSFAAADDISHAPPHKQRGFIFAALAALSFAAPDMQAQETTNICDRTQQVVDEILRLTATDGDECGSVSVSEMAANFGSIFNLNDKGIMSLKPGDFAGVSGVTTLILNNNNLTELVSGTFSGLQMLASLIIEFNSLSVLYSGTFSNLPGLTSLTLHGNQLQTLPPSFFSELTRINAIVLANNPGAPFLLTVKFEPEALEKDFTAAPVKVVLREGAPRAITVPLQITGPGAALMDGSLASLTIAAGSTQSDTVTVIKGNGYFKLSQGELELDEPDFTCTGCNIVRGPPITFGSAIRVRVFLEGALE